MTTLQGATPVSGTEGPVREHKAILGLKAASPALGTSAGLLCLGVGITGVCSYDEFIQKFPKPLVLVGVLVLNGVGSYTAYTQSIFLGYHTMSSIGVGSYVAYKLGYEALPEYVRRLRRNGQERLV